MILSDKTIKSHMFLRRFFNTYRHYFIFATDEARQRYYAEKEKVHNLRNASLLNISPYHEENVQPSSYDLTLGTEFKQKILPNDEVAGIKCIDPHKPVGMEKHMVFDDGYFLLYPNTPVLATTEEYISLPHYISAKVEGRSSWGRLFVTMHQTAGYIDPGFKGQVTLEIINLNDVPIKLYPGDKICQIVFETMDHTAEKPYGSEGLGSRYQSQKGATISKFYEDLIGELE